METTTYIKNLRISAKKLRFLIDDIKKMSPRQALDALFHSRKRSARILYGALKSAVDTAKKVSKTEEDLLQFKRLAVEEGQALKRSMSGGRGTVKLYKRKSAHVKIVLEEERKKTEDRSGKLEGGKLEIKKEKNGTKS